MRVRITGRARVHYELFVDMPADEAAYLMAQDVDKFERAMQHRFLGLTPAKIDPVEDIDIEVLTVEKG